MLTLYSLIFCPLGCVNRLWNQCYIVAFVSKHSTQWNIIHFRLHLVAACWSYIHHWFSFSSVCGLSSLEANCHSMFNRHNSHSCVYLQFLPLTLWKWCEWNQTFRVIWQWAGTHCQFFFFSTEDSCRARWWFWRDYLKILTKAALRKSANTERDVWCLRTILQWLVGVQPGSNPVVTTFSRVLFPV